MIISVPVCEVPISDWFCSAEVGDRKYRHICFWQHVKDGSISRYVRIGRDGDLSIDEGLKNRWKFSRLEEEQNIEDLLATPSSKKVYYRDFLEKINKRGFASGVTEASEICGGRTERSETPCCHQETLEQDKIETNKLRTRRLGNTDFSFILYDVFSWTLSLLLKLNIVIIGRPIETKLVFA